MKKIRNCMLTSLALFAFGMTSPAQDAVSRGTFRAAGPAVTISVTERGVRFAALGSFGKMRLEVFNADGTSLYGSDFGAASVRDWVLDNKDGQLLPDGTYLCVITIRDLSGRMSTKQGSVVLQGGQPSLKLPDGESVEVVEPDRSLARVTDPPDNALTLIGTDGKNGQIVNTRGALTFRFGDFFGGKDKELMRLTEEGNLGIGIARPEFKLDVAGAIRAREGFIFNDGSSLNVNDKGALTLISNGKDPLTLTNGGGTVTPSATGTGTQNYIAKWAETGGAGTLQNSGIFETAGGNVGIGTASPGSPLEVQQAAAPTVPNMYLSQASTASKSVFQLLKVGSNTWSFFGHNIYFNGSSNVLVDPTKSGWAFYANGDTTDAFYVYSVASGGGDSYPFMLKRDGRLKLSSGNFVPLGNNQLEVQVQNPGYVGAVIKATGSQSASLQEWQNSSGAVISKIDSSGNLSVGTSTSPTGGVATFNGSVGIGTTNPQAPLDVNGNLNVTGNATISGNIAAKYQDIAEWTSARTKLASGTVVTLDTLKPNSVMASDKPYDTRVAGVVSEQPGVILGEGGPNRVLVATTGRVKVRVNANRSSIHIGDLLVTSNVPGVAMKSQPFRVRGKMMHRPGTIVGKALEPLSRGEGTILVLLSLQ